MNRVSTRVKDLTVGMVLGETIHDHEGNELLAEGIVLRPIYINKIKELGRDTVIIVDERDTVVLATPADFQETVNRDLLIRQTRAEAGALVSACMEKALSKRSVEVEKIILVVNKIIDEIFKNEDITLNLADLKSVDEYVFQHSVNACVLSIITGIYMGFNKVRLVEIGVGALLHDLGKVLVPQNILNKPGRLTADEFEIVKRHTVRGYEVLRKIEGISEDAALVALEHHERFDGQGYPNQKQGPDIHVYSKIVAIADVFDAITSDRVYSQKEDPYTAMDYILRTCDEHFEKEIVRMFLKVVGFYPLGLHVFLSSGDYGVIVRKNREIPVVRILVDGRMNPVKGYYEVDLVKNPKIRIHDIDPKQAYKIQTFGTHETSV